MKRMIAILILLASVVAAAQSPRVLSFSQWKAQQVTDAQNRIARLSNKLTLIKSEQAAKQPVKPLEAELLGATQALEIAKQYSLDHYVATYLTQYADSRDALLELSQVTPKEEMADLLAAILKVRPTALTAIPRQSPQAF